MVHGVRPDAGLAERSPFGCAGDDGNNCAAARAWLRSVAVVALPAAPARASWVAVFRALARVAAHASWDGDPRGSTIDQCLDEGDEAVRTLCCVHGEEVGFGVQLKAQHLPLVALGADLSDDLMDGVGVEPGAQSFQMGLHAHRGLGEAALLA
jgi:hypothetical protein